MSYLAHYVETYLDLTCTWLYAQIIKSKNFSPIVLADKGENLNSFPFRDIFILRDNRRFEWYLRNQLRWRLNLFVFDDYFEKVLKDYHVKILYSHFGNNACYNLNLVKKMHLNHVVRFYGYDLFSVLKQNPDMLKHYKRLFNDVELFLVEGHHMKASLVNLGCEAKKVEVMPLGVDLENIRFIPRVFPLDGNIKFLFAGNFTEKKGLPYAIQAFKLARKTMPNISLTIIGGPTGNKKDKEENLKIMKGIKSEDSINYIGKVSHSELIKIAANHHIFISPSVNAKDGDCEGGAPVSIIEMSASGMPIVSAQHCDIPEVVMDRETGLLVPERDIEALSNAIIEICKSGEKWELMGKKARIHVENSYNLDEQVRKQEELILSKFN